jgi:hypothetical protein
MRRAAGLIVPSPRRGRDVVIAPRELTHTVRILPVRLETKQSSVPLFRHRLATGARNPGHSSCIAYSTLASHARVCPMLGTRCVSSSRCGSLISTRMRADTPLNSAALGSSSIAPVRLDLARVIEYGARAGLLIRSTPHPSDGWPTHLRTTRLTPACVGAGSIGLSWTLSLTRGRRRAHITLERAVFTPRKYQHT